MIAHRVLIRYAPWNLLARRSPLYTTSRCFGCSFILSRAAVQNMEENRELFEYTSGRWIYNESRRLAERHLVFNIDELKKAAAKSVNRPTSDIKSFRKFAEGGFNRVFEISMNDGSSILARLPYPSTLPQRLTVASEVATIDFVRAHGLPAPRILGYSVGENPVGAEYILMEKLPGKPVGDAWFDLSEKQRLQILYDIVKLESQLFNINLPASGSIYYSRDLHPSIARVDIPGSDGGLCIGPYAALRWWFGQRGDLNIDRGPHGDPRRVLQAPAEKELAWINTYGRPRFPFERQQREAFDYKKQDPRDHANSLAEYLRLAPYLIPTCSELNPSVLRHPDLHPNNIFVSENLRITGLIDWQHAVVLPTFLAAGIPNSFQNYNDAESRSFTPPKLPANIESLDEDEHAKAHEQFRRRHVHFFYLGFTQRLNEHHWRALEQETDLLKRRIFDHAGNPWEGLNTPLQFDLAQVWQSWSKIAIPNSNGTIPSCPISLTEQEAQRRNVLDDSHRDADADMEQVNGYLGVASDGWTPHDQFKSAKEEARSIREQGLASADDDPWLREMSERHWPFDDYDEDE